MTVGVKSLPLIYLGDGVTTAFGANFRYLDPSDLVVELLGSGLTVWVRQTLGVDYSATDGDTDSGGTVTMTQVPATGSKLRIGRYTSREQDSRYVTTDRFPSSTVEGDFDRAVLIDQEQDASIIDLRSRGVLVPFGEQGITLPPVAKRAETVFTFGADGQYSGEFSAADLRTAINLVAAALVNAADASQVLFDYGGSGSVGVQLQDLLRGDAPSLEHFGGGQLADFPINKAAWQAMLAAGNRHVRLWAGRSYSCGTILSTDDIHDRGGYQQPAIILPADMRLIDGNDATLLFQDTYGMAMVPYLEGDFPVIYSYIAQDIAVGDTVIHLEAGQGSDWQVGDRGLWRIGSLPYDHPETWNWSFFQIRAVNGDAVTLDRAMPEAFSVASVAPYPFNAPWVDGPTIYNKTLWKMPRSQGLTIRDLNIEGVAGHTAETGIAASYLEDAQFLNLTTRNVGIGLGLQYCSNAIIDNLVVDDGNQFNNRNDMPRGFAGAEVRGVTLRNPHFRGLKYGISLEDGCDVSVDGGHFENTGNAATGQPFASVLIFNAQSRSKFSIHDFTVSGSGGYQLSEITNGTPRDDGHISFYGTLTLLSEPGQIVFQQLNCILDLRSAVMGRQVYDFINTKTWKRRVYLKSNMSAALLGPMGLVKLASVTCPAGLTIGSSGQLAALYIGRLGENGNNFTDTLVAGQTVPIGNVQGGPNAIGGGPWSKRDQQVQVLIGTPTDATLETSGLFVDLEFEMAEDVLAPGTVWASDVDLRGAGPDAGLRQAEFLAASIGSIPATSGSVPGTLQVSFAIPTMAPGDIIEAVTVLDGSARVTMGAFTSAAGAATIVFSNPTNAAVAPSKVEILWRKSLFDTQGLPTYASPPTITSLVAGSGQVGLVWSAPSSNGGSAISDYHVEYKLDTAPTWTTFGHSPSTALSLSVTGLTDTLEYDFRVSTVNGLGVGAPSAVESSSPTPAGINPPDAPAFSLAPTVGGFTLAFTDEYNGGSAIYAHPVWVSTTSGFTPGPETLFNPNIGTPYSPNGLAPGVPLFVRLGATNSQGTTIAAEKTVTPALEETLSRLSISAGASSVNEGTALVVTVNRVGDISTSGSVVVGILAASGSTGSGADFGGSLPTATINFAANQTAGTVSFTPTADNLTEGAENFQAVIVSSAFGALIDTATVNFTVNDTSLTPVTALGPTAASFYVSAAAGATIAAITGLLPGETITTISPNDGRVVLNSGGTAIVVGLTSSSAGTATTYTLTSSTSRTLATVISALAAPVYRNAPALGQSNVIGRDVLNRSIDTDQANVKQVADAGPNIGTILDSVLPYYMQEGSFANNYLSYVNYSAKTVAAALPTGQVVLIDPCAHGETQLVGSVWAVGGSLYEAAVTRATASVNLGKSINSASSYHSTTWGQGENDAQVAIAQADYTAALTTVIHDWWSRVPGAAGTPFVISGMLPEIIASDPHYAAIDAAHRQVAAAIPGVHYVIGPVGCVLAGPHYNATGARTLGPAVGAAQNGMNVVAWDNTPGTASPNVSANEGNSGTVTRIHNVVRSSAVGAATIPVVFAAGGTSTADYPGGVYPTGLTAAFADGSLTTTVSVTTNGNTTVDGNRAYALSFGTMPTGYVVGTRPTSVGTVLDDDVAGGVGTNLIAAAAVNDAGNALWTPTGIAVTTNVGVSPVPTNFDRLAVADTSTSNHRIAIISASGSGVTTAGETLTMAADFVYESGNQFVQLQRGSGAQGMFANFDIKPGETATGTFGAAVSGTTITALGGNVFRCTATFTEPTAARGQLNIAIVPSNTSAAGASYAGTVGSVLVGNQQIVNGPAANAF